MKQEKNNHRQLLSIIVPSYKAEKFIQETLLSIQNALEQVPYNYEIICVVDGMLDHTEREAQKIAGQFQGKLRVVSYKENVGKGHAVRYGMAYAKGDLIGFIDAGLDIDPSSIPMLLEHMKWYDADIIIGSKRHPASKVLYPWQRRVLSFGYQMGVRILFGLKVKDTQVGLKVFKREVIEKVLPRVLVKKFAFDVEFLVVANYLGFKKIYEAPIELHLDFGKMSIVTSKGLWKNIFFFIWDTVAVFYRLKILHYYDTKNKKSWITPEHLQLPNKTI